MNGVFAMRLYIITGTSEGIGASLAEQLLSQGNEVYCISKYENASLLKYSRMRQLALTYKLVDLADVEASIHCLEEILSKVKAEEWKQVCLILNAAVITPIRKVGQGNHIKEIRTSFELNLISPIVLSEVFVRMLQDWDLDKQILFLGSKAGTNPVASFSTYCSTKAGLDTFAKTLAKEQNSEPRPIKVVSLHPGVVDTGMQETIRQQPREKVESVDYFIDLKKNKQLLSPEIVACEIIKLLKDSGYGKDTIVDIRDLLIDQGNI